MCLGGRQDRPTITFTAELRKDSSNCSLADVCGENTHAHISGTNLWAESKLFRCGSLVREWAPPFTHFLLVFTHGTPTHYTIPPYCTHEGSQSDPEEARNARNASARLLVNQTNFFEIALAVISTQILPQNSRTTSWDFLSHVFVQEMITLKTFSTSAPAESFM